MIIQHYSRINSNRRFWVTNNGMVRIKMKVLSSFFRYLIEKNKNRK